VKLKCEDEVCSLVSHNQHKSTGRESGNVTPTGLQTVVLLLTRPETIKNLILVIEICT